MAAKATASPHYNSVNISNSAYVAGNVTGGESNNGDASFNSIIMTDGQVDGFVLGGDSINGMSSHNAVSISGGSVGEVRGGQSESDAAFNSVTISGTADVVGDVFAGHSSSGDASGNSIAILGGQVGGDVTGGYTDGANADATGNRVTLGGGQVIGTVYGGNGVGAGDLFTGNVLSVANSGLSVGGIGSFQHLNFILPAGAAPGATMLNVTAGGIGSGTADLTDSWGGASGASSIIGLSIAGGGSALKAGDHFTLIQTAAAGDLIANPDLNRTANATQGVSLRYTFDITHDTQTLWADLASVSLNPQTKALSEGRAGGLAFVNQGADLVLQQGVGGAIASTSTQRSGAFGAVSGGSSRYNTGSHVDVDGASLITGLGWRPGLDNNALLLGAFVEAGWGNYDSHNGFSNAATVKGDGDTNYYGAGVLARYDVTAGNLAGLYGQGAFRAGRSKADFSSNDMIAADGQRASYDSAAAYYGLQGGLGYIFNLTKATSLDLSSTYLWTHQNSDSVTVAGDPIRFDAMDSHRWRNGGRLNYTVDSANAARFAPYVGAYHEYEFDGEANGTAYGLSIDAPTLKGSTGIGEIGFGFKPAADSALSLDLGAQGYTGVREGVSGRLTAKIAL